MNTIRFETFAPIRRRPSAPVPFPKAALTKALERKQQRLAKDRRCGRVA